MGYGGSGRLATDVRLARRYESRLAATLVVLGLVHVVLLVNLDVAAAEPARRSPGPIRLTAVVYVVASLVAIVLWLRWFRVVYRAVAAAGVARHDPVMVVAGWLVPGLWLFVPKRMVDDVWRAGGDRAPLPWVVRWWWRLWCAAMVVHTVDLVARLFLDVRLSGPRFTTVESVLLLAAVPFAIGTVVALTARLDRVGQWVTARAGDADPRAAAETTAGAPA